MINIGFNRTKIVATVGPASNTKEKLLELMVAGVDIFRLNFSHGSHEEHLKVIQNIRELNQKFNFNVGILQDLQGPKIRLREVENNGIEIQRGEKVILAYEQQIGTRDRLTTTYDLAQDVKPGEPILIDDGNIELRTIQVTNNEVHAEVIHGGLVKSKKGINLPNTVVSEPSLTKKDREDLMFGLEHDIDWIALSFVRAAPDLMELRGIIEDQNKRCRIIAKIETPQALKNIDAIIAAADGLMVARGDLGVEIPTEQVPIEQKKLVRKCNLAAKPVIIATQMMESMIKNPRPTRAEANDVANGVMDGADAVMLSAETASGSYPLETVKTMVNIIGAVERQMRDLYHNSPGLDTKDEDFYSKQLITNACELAKSISAKALMAMTKSGFTAFHIASRRPEADIFVFTENRYLLTQLNLVWGVRCFYYDKQVSTDETFTDFEEMAQNAKLLSKGDVIIHVASMPMAERKRTNTIKVTKIE